MHFDKKESKHSCPEMSRSLSHPLNSDLCHNVYETKIFQNDVINIQQNELRLKFAGNYNIRGRIYC